MIRGFFRETVGRRRPFVRANLSFPSLGGQRLTARFMIDTGADRTILAPQDIIDLRIDLRSLPAANPSRGVGGQLTEARWIDGVFTMGRYSTTHRLTVLLPERPSFRITSILGRDILEQFALYIDARNGLVLLLEPHEADALRPHLPVT